MESLVLPQFMEFRALHLLGTYWALILPAVAAPVAVFVFHAFFRQIPSSLIEAARIDGASWWRIYAKICMPLCRPAISAVAILTFITTWNAFLWPFLAITKPELMNVTVGATSIRGELGELATALLTGLPVAVVYLLFQRRVTEAVMLAGSIKG